MAKFKITNRLFSILFIVSFFFLSLSCQNKKASKLSREKSNILFIAVDDLRLQAGIYGKSQMKTPGLDALGKSGMVFTRAYCNVPVCGASRASLLSGVRPTKNRFVNYYTRKDKDAPEVQSIPMWFKNNGYTTLCRGKIYHHDDDDVNAWSEKPYLPKVGIGWQSYITEQSKEIIDANYNPEKPNNIIGPAYEAADVADNAYPDGMLTEKAIEDLRKFAKTKEPFFLGLGYWKPHLPFNAPKKYWDLYSDGDLKLATNPEMPENAPKEAKHNWNELRGMYADMPQEGPLSEETAKKLIHGYYACVSYTDAQIAMVLNELEKVGLAENTIVILWGDHGWHLGDHGLWCKHCNFDKVLNAPLIIRAPGKSKNIKSNALTEFIDIYPTLCELAGIDSPEHLDGKSLVPVLNNPKKSHKKAVYARYHEGESVITSDFSYTQWENGAQMLYNHKSDPNENKNIAEDKDYSNTANKMKALLELHNITLNQ